MGCGNLLSGPNSNHRLETTVYNHFGADSTELICFRLLRCEIALRRQKLILPEAQATRNYGTEVTFKSPVGITAPQKDFPDSFCDGIFTLRCPKSIIQCGAAM